MSNGGKLAIVHVLPRIAIGGLLRHLQAAEQLPSRFTHEIVSIFDMNDARGVEALKSPVNELKIPLAKYLDEQMVKDKLAKPFHHADLVHSYHMFSDFYAIPLAAELRRPVVRTVAGISQVAWLRPTERNLARTDWSADEIQRELLLEPAVSLTIAVSNETKHRLLAYGIPNSKLRLSYLGTDIPSADPRASEVSEDRASNIITLGFMHRLESFKAPPFLLAGLQKLQERNIRPRLLVVSHGHHAQAFLSEAKSARIDVIVFPPSTDIWDILPPMDCMLLTSESEGLPLLMLEAMARGIPVVANRVGGVTEAIENKVSGYLLDAADAKDLAMVLAHVFANPEERRAVAQVGKAVVQQRFKRSKHISDLQEIYETCAWNAR